MDVQSGSIQVGVETGTDGVDVTYTDKNVGTAYGVYINEAGSYLSLGVKDVSDAKRV